MNLVATLPKTPPKIQISPLFVTIFFKNIKKMFGLITSCHLGVELSQRAHKLAIYSKWTHALSGLKIYLVKH